jgi:ABC-2 type transport system ATP-binding protein
VIEATDLSKLYGDVVAVEGLSFCVGAGEVVGFLGPNGAGKTTTLRMLAGFLAPTRGHITIAGHDATEFPLQARRSLGYMAETCPLYPELRVEEYLSFRARLKLVPSKRVKGEVERALRLATAYDRRGALIGQLSRGLRQRVGLADVLLGRPPLLILDEPTAGLDPNQIREVRDLIANLKRDHTILLSTHILEEVEKACDRAIVINKGRLVAEGTLVELRERRESERAELTLETRTGRGADLRTVLSGVAEVVRSSTAEQRVHHELRLSEPARGLAPVLERLASSGFSVHEARLIHDKLEDVFERLTREQEGDG